MSQDNSASLPLCSTVLDRKSFLKQRLTFFISIHVSLHLRTKIPSFRLLSAVVQWTKNWQTPGSTQKDFNLTLEVILTKCCFPGTNYLIDWSVDSINIHHLGLWLFNVSDVLCICLFRRDVFKICMTLNILHALFLLQLTWQDRDSLKCPQRVPSSPRTANAPDLKLLRGSRWAEIFWNAWNAEHCTLLLRAHQQQWCGWRGGTEVVSFQHGQILPHCVLSAAQLSGQVLYLIYWVTSSEPVRTLIFYIFFLTIHSPFFLPFQAVHFWDSKDQCH